MPSGMLNDEACRTVPRVSVSNGPMNVKNGVDL